MEITYLPVGPIETNCYILCDETAKVCAVIDPGDEAERIASAVERTGCAPCAILLTHGHFDHTGAVNELRETLGIPVYAHENSDRYLLDGEMNLSAFCVGEKVIRNVRKLRDGDIVCLRDGSCRLRVIHTPGHTTDSVVYYSEKDRVAFVGDTIFKGSAGNWQYPGGNRQTLVESITEKIFALPDDTVLYSGHSEETTIGTEKRRYY